MLRALRRLLTRTAASPVRPAAPRFAPALHPLEAREVPALFTASALADATAVARGDAPADTTSAKVKLQDIHFVAHVGKSSP